MVQVVSPEPEEAVHWPEAGTRRERRFVIIVVASIVSIDEKAGVCYEQIQCCLVVSYFYAVLLVR